MSRILRRPMFRGGGKVSSYGNGIASGLADGGKVQPLLVGQHPESAKGPDGREKHFAPLVAGGALLARAAPYASRLYQGFKAGKTMTPGNLGFLGRAKDLLTPSTRFRNTTIPKVDINKSLGRITEGSQQSKIGILQALKDPSRLGQAIRENPITSLGALTVPNMAIQAAPGLGKGALELGKRYIDAVIPGEQFRETEEDIVVEGPTAAEIQNKKLIEELYKLRKAQATEPSSEEYKMKDITDRKARLKAKAEGYEELLGDGIKRDSIFDAMVEGGTRLYEGEGAGAAIRAANKALDPIQNIKTASRKLALEEDIAIRKAIASARPGTAEQNYAFYKSRFPDKNPEEIIEMMTSSAGKDLDRKIKARQGGQGTTVIWANSTYGDSEEYGGVLVTDVKGNKQIADGTKPKPGKKYYDITTDTFIVYDEQLKGSPTTPPK